MSMKRCERVVLRSYEGPLVCGTESVRIGHGYDTPSAQREPDTHRAKVVMWHLITRVPLNFAANRPLHRVIVDPQRGQPETEQLLKLSTSTTRGEGLGRTPASQQEPLYAINGLKRVSEPFPMTEPIKISDDQPISPDYGYSYTLIYTHSL